jgi:hypothetical protein
MTHNHASNAMHTSRLDRLKKAADRRDELLEAVGSKLLDLQQLMLNHGTQLRALYDGRRADLAALLQDPSTKEGAFGTAPTCLMHPKDHDRPLGDLC